MVERIKEITLLLDQAQTIRTNDLKKSFEIASKALQLSEQMDNQSLIGKSLSQLALYKMVTGEMEKATHFAKRAIEVFEAINDEKGLADAKYSLAGVYYKTNLYHLGLINFTDALRIYKKHKDYYNQSRTEKSLGTIYEYIGDPTNAFMVYKDAIKNAKKIQDFNLESNVYNNLSGILAKNGKLDFAMKLIEKSIQLKKETNDMRGMAYALYGKAKIYNHLNENEEAQKFYYEALKIHQEMGENTGICMTYTKLGEFYFKLKDLDKALEYSSKGLDLSSQLKLSMSTIKLNKLMSDIFNAKGEFEKAYFYLHNHLKEKEIVINTQTLKVIENYEMITKMKSLEKEAQLQKEKQKILEKKNRDEIDAYKQKQEFLSIMSHEIRTPLNAITTSISILDEQVTNEGKKLLGNLKFASNNLISIVNDVLDFTKLDTNNAKLVFTSCNLFELSSNIIELYHHLGNQKNIHLKWITTIDQKSNYLIDQTKLTQILSNLISNAIKFTEKGTITLEVKLLERNANKDAILFKVIDTGEGVSEESLKEIFNSFSQLKPYLTRKQGGTGLGLAIVKKLVELYGSSINVKSKVGIGSEFYFVLDLERIESLPDQKVMQYDSLVNTKILIVDDTKMNAVLLKKLLSKWDINADYAESGFKALEIVKEFQYDFILMDIHMPEMNGFETSKKIRESENKNKKTAIYALTADILADKETNFFSYFSGIIHKPFEIDKLYKLLSQK